MISNYSARGLLGRNGLKIASPFWPFALKQKVFFLKKFENLDLLSHDLDSISYDKHLRKRDNYFTSTTKTARSARNENGR